MLSKLSEEIDNSLDMRLLGSLQSAQQLNTLRSLSSRVAEGNGPKKPGNPPASSRGRVQTPAEYVFREMRGMEIPRARRACCRPLHLIGEGDFVIVIPPLLSPGERVCGESVDPRRRQRAVAAENSASSLAGGHAPLSSVSNRRGVIARPSRVRRTKRRYPASGLPDVATAQAPGA